jgi:hypothetical protein
MIKTTVQTINIYIFKFYLLITFAFVFWSCQNDSLEIQDEKNKVIKTRSVVTPTFDWENADWMPTPNGQALIPTPWIGQGSIASTYGTDVINDRSSADGWELLYNTFNANSQGPLVT